MDKIMVLVHRSEDRGAFRCKTEKRNGKRWHAGLTVCNMVWITTVFLLAIPSPVRGDFTSPTASGGSTASNSTVGIVSAKRVVGSRPCIPSSVVVNILTGADFAKRLKYPANQVVYLVLRNNIVLRHGLNMDGNFSCSIVMSSVGKRFTLSLRTTAFPVLKIEFTNNILIYGVNFNLPITDLNHNRHNCSFPEVTNGDFIGKYSCPAIWMYQVYAIQVVQGSSHGRIDIFRAAYTRVDSMRVVVNPLNFPANIRVSISGDGPNLVRANIWITNNDLYAAPYNIPAGKGAEVGIMVLRGGVGVNIYNNRLHNFILASLQIGFGQTNVGDAMLNYASNNEILHSFGQIGEGTPMDVAGIYLDTHWANPGNYLRCNYVEEGGHCLYLDWVSSATVVDGLVCYKTADGLKLNTGKNNHVTGMIMIDTTEPSIGYISCQNYWENNCGHFPGNVWAQKIRDFYQTPRIKKAYPYLTDICTRTSIRGIYCNAGTDRLHSAKVTGNCSGLPTENYVELVSATVDGSQKKAFFQDNCRPFPSVMKLNSIKYYNTSISKAGFNSISTRDFGLAHSRFSAIKRVFPAFRSCPKKLIGPKRVAFRFYFSLFNINLPQTRPVLQSLSDGLSANPKAATVVSTLRAASSHPGGEPGETEKDPFNPDYVEPQVFTEGEEDPTAFRHARASEFYAAKNYEP